MSFIISIESFLPLVNVSWWPVCDGEAETQRPTQTSTRHVHTPPHTFSDTHWSACWLYQTLLLLPAEIDLKKINNFKKGQKN